LEHKNISKYGERELKAAWTKGRKLNEGKDPVRRICERRKLKKSGLKVEIAS
jgi:hypothetical protein